LHFLELLSELPSRFGVRLHAYVLMDNHYHLLMETPEANLSRALQWLNVSYSVWFNRRHRRSGHLFQGRFKAVLIEEDSGFQRVGRYVHLNPVRVVGLGLDKRSRKTSGKGLGKAAEAEVVRQRLRLLRDYRWSSYPAVAGYRAAPEWLSLTPLRQLCGGRREPEQIAAVRRYTEEAVREGRSEQPWEGLVGGMILGSAEYAHQLLKGLKQNRREQPQLSQRKRRASWEEVIRAVEKAKGEPWNAFSQRHGDWGRDAAWWLGRHAGRMRLGELAKRSGRCDYTTVGKAVSRFNQRLTRDRVLARQLETMKHELSEFEI
jgi:putative transposase